MAWYMANERRERCRALGRVDQSSGEDDERKMNYEIIGAAGELAVAKTFNLCPDFGEQSGLADFRVQPFKFNRTFKYNTLDVKTVAAGSKGKNLLVNKSATHCDIYVLVEQMKNIEDGEYKIHGWISGRHVRATPIGEVQKNCHFVEASELRNCNCPIFFGEANRLASRQPGDPDPPPPLSEPTQSFRCAVRYA